MQTDPCLNNNNGVLITFYSVFMLRTLKHLSKFRKYLPLGPFLCILVPLTCHPSLLHNNLFQHLTGISFYHFLAYLKPPINTCASKCFLQLNNLSIANNISVIITNVILAIQAVAPVSTIYIFFQKKSVKAYRIGS